MGQNLQDLLAVILKSSGPDELKKTFATDGLKSSVAQWFQDIPAGLTTLEPQAHGVGCVLLLHAMTAHLAGEGEEMGEAEKGFANSAERVLTQVLRDHVDAVPLQFVAVCAQYCAVCVGVGRAITAIVPLRTACDKLQIGPSHITSAHPLFLRACIASKCYHAGRAMVQQDLCDVDPKRERLDTLSLLCHFYYAGIVCVGLRMFERALHNFSLVFTIPAEALSAVVVESFKRFILVSLIVDGKVPESHAHMSAATRRHIKTITEPYHEFAAACTARDLDKVHQCFKKHESIFREDNVTGLVKQCITNVTRVKVQQLTGTYLTLPLQRIQESAGLSHVNLAEKWLLDMISKHQIHATIHQSNGMVSFHDGDGVSAEHTRQRLDESMATIQALGDRLERMHREVQLDPKFVAKSVGAQRSRQSEWDAGDAEMSDLLPGAPEVPPL